MGRLLLGDQPARSKLCSITRVIQRLYTRENATAKITMPTAVPAFRGPGAGPEHQPGDRVEDDHESHATAHGPVSWKHIGHMAKARNQAFGFAYSATASRTVMPAR